MEQEEQEAGQAEDAAALGMLHLGTGEAQPSEGPDVLQLDNSKGADEPDAAPGDALGAGLTPEPDAAPAPGAESGPQHGLDPEPEEAAAEPDAAPEPEPGAGTVPEAAAASGPDPAAEHEPAPEPQPEAHPDADAPRPASAQEPPQPPTQTAQQQEQLQPQQEAAKPTSVYLCAKWPEGADWACNLAGELQAMGVEVVHDARHQARLMAVESMVRESAVVVMLVTPGFHQALCNKPAGNRALKEVQWAVQHGKRLVAVAHASYCGQNPLDSLVRDVVDAVDGEIPWSEEELLAVAAAQPVYMFRGADGFDGYQRELARVVAAGQAEQAAGGGGEAAAAAAGGDAELQEKRLKDVLRAAGVGKRAPALLDAHIRTLPALEGALRRGRLAAKPHNWNEAAVKRTLQVLEAWPSLCSMPDWQRAAPPELVPLLSAAMAQEEATEYDREGKPRPRKSALPPCTALDLAGQGPVVVGPKGGAAVAAMIRDCARAACARASGGGGSAVTMLHLTVVDLTDCGLGAAAAGEVMQAVGGCPSVAKLLLGGNGLDDSAAGDFAAMMRKQQAAREERGGAGAAGGLRVVGLERNQLGDKGAAGILLSLEDSPGVLEAIDLGSNPGLGAATAEALERVMHARSGGRSGRAARLLRVGLADAQMDDAALARAVPALVAPTPALGSGEEPGAGGGSSSRACGVEELDISGNGADAAALAALAAAAQQPGYLGGPRVLNLSGANLRTVAAARRPTAESAAAAPGAVGTPGGGAAALAEMLLHSHNVEELRLGWCGLSGSGMGVLVRSLLGPAAGGKRSSTGEASGDGGGGEGEGEGEGEGATRGSFVQPQAAVAPLVNLHVLDLTGNRLGPEGVHLLGALLPVGIPSLRHLVLDECGLAGQEVAVLAGVLDLAPWVVTAVNGALCYLLTDDVTGGERGVWKGTAVPPLRSEQHEDDPGGPGALAAALRAWLGMEPAAAAAELRRLLAPTSALAPHHPGAPPAGGAGGSNYGAGALGVGRKGSTTVSSAGGGGLGGAPHASISGAMGHGTSYSGGAAAGGSAAANGGAAAASAPAAHLGGLGCLLAHPAVRPVLDTLRALWEALAAEAAETAAAGGPQNLLQLPMYSDPAQAAFRRLNAAVQHMQRCAEVPGLQSLSLGRNTLSTHTGAPLGAALRLSCKLRHLGLRGAILAASPAALAAAAAAGVGGGAPLRGSSALGAQVHRAGSSGSAAALRTGTAGKGGHGRVDREAQQDVGPLAAAAAAARDADALLALLFPSAVGSSAPGSAVGRSSVLFSPGRPGTAAGAGPSRGGTTPGDDILAGLPVGAFAEPKRPASKAGGAANGASGPAASASLGLKSLDLTDAGICPANSAQLAALLQCLPSLEQLVLDFNSLGGAATPAAAGGGGGASGPAAAGPNGSTQALFQQLAAMPALASLSLNYSCNGGAMLCVADDLLGTGNCPGLRILSLVGCPLDQFAARKLARAMLHNTGLAVLRAGGGDPPEGVGPMGSRALGEGLCGHKGLVELALAGAGVTDSFVQALAGALGQLPNLCKLDLSNNVVSGWGAEALAHALMTRNRNAVGAAADNRVAVQIHGNPIPEDVHQRLVALSALPSTTRHSERMPPLTDYTPPLPRGASGAAGLGAGAGSGGGAAGAGGAQAGAARGGAAARRGNVPSAPSLVPPSTLLHAPVVRPVVQPPPFNPPRCATATSTRPSTSASAAAGKGGRDGEQPPFVLSSGPGAGVGAGAAGGAHPAPGRHRSALARSADEGDAAAAAVAGANGAGAHGDRGEATRANGTLARIYGVPRDAVSNGTAKRSGGNTPASRPTTSHAPLVRPVPGPLLGSRPAGSAGAPYASAPIAPIGGGYKGRPHAGSNDAGAGAGSGGAAGTKLPAVGRTSINGAAKQPAGDTPRSQERGEGGGGSARQATAGGEGGGGARVSPHLTQSLKCHTPDWVQRMQEDHYKRLTAPARPASTRQHPPAGPPPQHLVKPLKCHDSSWIQQQRDQQLTRERRSEDAAGGGGRPGAGSWGKAPRANEVAAGSGAAAVRRSLAGSTAPGVGEGKGERKARRSEGQPRDGAGGGAAEGGLLDQLEQNGLVGAGDIGGEESVEMLAVQTTGGRKSKIAVVHVKTAKRMSVATEEDEEGDDGEQEEGGQEEGREAATEDGAGAGEPEEGASGAPQGGAGGARSEAGYVGDEEDGEEQEEGRGEDGRGEEAEEVAQRSASSRSSSSNGQGQEAGAYEAQAEDEKAAAYSEDEPEAEAQGQEEQQEEEQEEQQEEEQEEEPGSAAGGGDGDEGVGDGESSLGAGELGSAGNSGVGEEQEEEAAGAAKQEDDD